MKLRTPSVIALATLVVVGVVAGPTGAATRLHAPGATAPGPSAPRAAAPGPTAAHPFQGLRRLTIATIPPVAGVAFAVDGRRFLSDANGIASVLITKDQRSAVRAARDQHLTVVNPVVERDGGVRARFAGWSGRGQYRGGTVPEEYQHATFDIEYLTSFGFANGAGAPVGARTIDTMRLRSSTGERLVLHRFDPIWLTGSLAATGRNGLQVRGVSYAVDSVTTRGATVVHRAQQRFFPGRRQIVVVPLLLFDVPFSAADVFFGGATGSTLALEYPDGSARSFPLDGNGAVTVRDLPRGTYQARVKGAGPGLAQQLTVSSAAPVALDTLTWLDTALIAGLVIAFVVALLLAGRAVRRRSRRRVGLDLVRVEDDERPEPELVGAP